GVAQDDAPGRGEGPRRLQQASVADEVEAVPVFLLAEARHEQLVPVAEQIGLPEGGEQPAAAEADAGEGGEAPVQAEEVAAGGLGAGAQAGAVRGAEPVGPGGARGAP